MTDHVRWDPDGLIDVADRETVLAAVRARIGDADFKIVSVAPVIQGLSRSSALIIDVQGIGTKMVRVTLKGSGR